MGGRLGFDRLTIFYSGFRNPDLRCIMRGLFNLCGTKAMVVTIACWRKKGVFTCARHAMRVATSEDGSGGGDQGCNWLSMFPNGFRIPDLGIQKTECRWICRG